MILRYNKWPIIYHIEYLYGLKILYLKMNENGELKMVTIHNNTFIPYEFDKNQAYRYITERCKYVKKSLRFLELTNEHLYVRCPFVGDYLEIVSSPEELQWIHERLTRNGWYRLT